MNYPSRQYKKKIKGGFKAGDLIMFHSEIPNHNNTWILIRRIQDPLDSSANAKSSWAQTPKGLRSRRRWFWITYNTHKQIEETHYEKSLRHKLLKFPSLWSLVRK
jgi:hypothetical protein